MYEAVDETVMHNFPHMLKKSLNNSLLVVFFKLTVYFNAKYSLRLESNNYLASIYLYIYLDKLLVLLKNDSVKIILVILVCYRIF